MKTTTHAPKTKSLAVAVTMKHINEGEPEAADSCPIALALTEKGLLDVSVETYRATFRRYDTGPQYELDLPKRAQKFVQAFDNGDDDVKPFKFKINPKKLRKTGR